MSVPNESEPNMDQPETTGLGARPAEDAPEVSATPAGPRFERAPAATPAAAPATAVAEELPSALEVKDLHLFYGDFLAVKDVNVKIARNRVTARKSP